MSGPMSLPTPPTTDFESLDVKALVKANKRLSAELAKRDGVNRPSAWRQHHLSSGKAKVRWADENEARTATMALAHVATAVYRCDWCDGWHIGRTS